MNAEWLHRFINCTPFGEHAPVSEIARAHEVLSALERELAASHETIAALESQIFAGASAAEFARERELRIAAERELAAARAGWDRADRERDQTRADAYNARAEVEAAFRAGYHCNWIKSERRYIFDPAMKPGDPDGAYAAWSRYQQERGKA